MASDRASRPKSVREIEETFAKANEQIRVSAEDHDFEESVPFLCECSETTCMQSVRLSLTSYREARAIKRSFIMIPGHHDASVERVVTQREGYVLVEGLASC
jgi:hypothetical protein